MTSDYKCIYITYTIPFTFAKLRFFPGTGQIDLLCHWHSCFPFKKKRLGSFLDSESREHVCYSILNANNIFKPSLCLTPLCIAFTSTWCTVLVVFQQGKRTTLLDNFMPVVLMPRSEEGGSTNGLKWICIWGKKVILHQLGHKATQNPHPQPKTRNNLNMICLHFN